MSVDLNIDIQFVLGFASTGNQIITNPRSSGKELFNVCSGDVEKYANGREGHIQAPLGYQMNSNGWGNPVGGISITYGNNATYLAMLPTTVNYSESIETWNGIPHLVTVSFTNFEKSSALLRLAL